MKYNWKKFGPLLFCSFILAQGIYALFGSILNSEEIQRESQRIQQEKIATKTTKNLVSRQLAQTTSKQTKQQKSTQNKPWQNISDPIIKITALQKCYDNEGTCGFPTTDPKSEFFAIGQAIKVELQKLQFEAQSNNTQSKMLQNLAVNQLRVPDGHVKEAALHLLATQETTTDGLQEILSSVIDFHDARLIPQAILELTRYQANFSETIDQALAKAMATGAPAVSEEISKNIHLLLNENNYGFYKRTLSSLSIGSLSYQNLKNSLDDFKKQMKAA